MFNELIKLAYKNRFSIYYKPNNVLLKVYFNNGKQHKENEKTIEECIVKTIEFLKRDKKQF